jgi:hypothetical protein
MAVHVNEADFAQPLELRVQISCENEDPSNKRLDYSAQRFAVKILLETMASKRPSFRERLVEVVRNDGYDGIIAKALAEFGEHSWGKVQANKASRRTRAFHQSQEAACSATKIQNAFRISGDELQKSGFAFAATRNGIGTLEIVEARSAEDQRLTWGCVETGARWSDLGV